MNIEDVKKAREKCRKALKTCTKKEITELLLDTLEWHHPEKLTKVAVMLEQRGL